MRRSRIWMCAVGLAAILMLPVTVQAKEEVEIPEQVITISEELGEQYDVCPELIQAICWTESRCQPDAKGGPCIGIMQVYEKWHRDRMERLGATDLYDMRQNMTVGVDYLAELFGKHGEASYVLDAYNGGSAMAEQNYRKGVLSKYAKGILELSAELERAHGK